MHPSRGLMPALAITMIVSWGSLYYAFAVLARPIQTELAWRADLTVGAYSVALLVAGLSAYAVGRYIDRHGGRYLMTLGSALAGVLFLLLSQVHSIYSFYAIWIGLGIAMAMTLYEPAFAVIVGAYPHAYRKRIGMLTLAGGLASTAFWPLTHFLVTHLQWRGAVIALGIINLLLCAPLHWFAVPATVRKHAAHTPGLPGHITPGLRRLLREPSFWLLTLSFMIFGAITAAMAVHVIPLLEARGLDAGAAVSLAALIGPMQVSGRLLEVLTGDRVPTLLLGGVTVLLIPLALLALWLGPSSLAIVYTFVIVYGAGLGLITIVKATTPAELFGHERYASLSGTLAAPTIVARAIGPFLATAALTAFGEYRAILLLMLAVSGAGALSYWLALSLHRRR